MSKYEFQSTLYRNEREMLDAIAEAWLGAGGANDMAYQRETLASVSDDDLAAECIAGWALDLAGDQPPWSSDEDRDPSHMGDNGYTADDLARAFGRLRALKVEG